jgi:hypothetical protein
VTCGGGLGRWIDDWAVVAWALVMLFLNFRHSHDSLSGSQSAASVPVLQVHLF